MKSITNNWKLFQYALRFTPQFVFLTVIDNLFLGFLNSYVTVIFLKVLFDQIEIGAEFSRLMYLVTFLLLFFVIGYIFHVIYMHFCEPRYKYKLHSAIQKILFEKLSKIEVEYYDNNTAMDLYNNNKEKIAHELALVFKKHYGNKISR